MFKTPFSFDDGRIRRIEYSYPSIVGGMVFSIAWALGISTFILGAGMGSTGGSVFGLFSRPCCIGCFHVVLFVAGGKTFARPETKSSWLILLMFVPYC